MTDYEKQKIQASVNKIYEDFTRVVKDGRKFPDTDVNGDNIPDAVDSIAQGRVWSGIRAKQLGLVDELGGIKTAIEIAATLAKLDKDQYRLKELPAQKDPFEEIISKLQKEEEEAVIRKLDMEKEFKMYKRLKQMASNKGVYMLMPYSFDIH
jgi:protease-4